MSTRVITPYDSLPARIDDVTSNGGAWYPLHESDSITPHQATGTIHELILLRGYMEMTIDIPTHISSSSSGISLSLTWYGCVVQECQGMQIAISLPTGVKNNSVPACPTMSGLHIYGGDIAGTPPVGWSNPFRVGVQSPMQNNGTRCSANIGSLALVVGARSADSDSDSNSSITDTTGAAVSNTPKINVAAILAGLLSIIVLLLGIVLYRRFYMRKREKERNVRGRWMSGWQKKWQWQAGKEAVPASRLTESVHSVDEGSGPDVREGSDYRANGSLIAGSVSIGWSRMGQRSTRKGMPPQVPVDESAEGSLSAHSHEESVLSQSTENSYSLPPSFRTSQSPEHRTPLQPLRVHQASTSKTEQLSSSSRCVGYDSTPRPGRRHVQTPSGNTLPVYTSDRGHGSESIHTHASRTGSSPPLYRSNPTSPVAHSTRSIYPNRVRSTEGDPFYMIQDRARSSINSSDSDLSNQSSIVSNPFL